MCADTHHTLSPSPNNCLSDFLLRIALNQYQIGKNGQSKFPYEKNPMLREIRLNFCMLRVESTEFCYHGFHLFTLLKETLGQLVENFIMIGKIHTYFLIIDSAVTIFFIVKTFSSLIH